MGIDTSTTDPKVLVIDEIGKAGATASPPIRVSMNY
jgi:hypothetical protein